MALYCFCHYFFQFTLAHIGFTGPRYRVCNNSFVMVTTHIPPARLPHSNSPTPTTPHPPPQTHHPSTPKDVPSALLRAPTAPPLPPPHLLGRRRRFIAPREKRSRWPNPLYARTMGAGSPWNPTAGYGRDPRHAQCHARAPLRTSYLLG